MHRCHCTCQASPIITLLWPVHNCRLVTHSHLHTHLSIDWQLPTWKSTSSTMPHFPSHNDTPSNNIYICSEVLLRNCALAHAMSLVEQRTNGTVLQTYHHGTCCVHKALLEVFDSSAALCWTHYSTASLTCASDQRRYTPTCNLLHAKQTPSYSSQRSCVTYSSIQVALHVKHNKLLEDLILHCSKLHTATLPMSGAVGTV